MGRRSPYGKPWVEIGTITGRVCVFVSALHGKKFVRL